MFKKADFYRIQSYTLQDSSQLACYTVSTGKQPSTFDTNLTISYSGPLLGLLDLKDEAITILRNVGNGLPVDTALTFQIFSSTAVRTLRLGSYNTIIVGKVINKNQYDNNANFVFCDTVPTLYQGVSVKCHGFWGTNINVISYMPVTKLRPLPAPNFPMKLTNAEQHHAQIFYTEFHPYGAIVTRRLTTGIRPEKCVVRRFRRCANVIECKGLPRQAEVAQGVPGR